MRMEIRLSLISDATLGRGDGVAALVDAEVEHDEYGLPFLRGRTLKGVLVEECANILYALHRSGSSAATSFDLIACQMFGQAGSTLDENGTLRIGAAQLPTIVRRAIRAGCHDGTLWADDVLDSLTAIRRQTAISAETGAPERSSLRSMRVVLRNTVFSSRITLMASNDQQAEEMTKLLAACVSSLRRAGTGRNRGRGRLKATLHDSEGNDITANYLDDFISALSCPQESA